MKQAQSFGEIIDRLERHYGKAGKPRILDALGLIIYENVAYLVPDEKRDAAYQALRKAVGLKPTNILAASRETLIELIRIGGVQPQRRAASCRKSLASLCTTFQAI